jgi:hypothetical protein
MWNRYGGKCRVCRDYVPAGEGIAHKSPSDVRWGTYHHRCAVEIGMVNIVVPIAQKAALFEDSEYERAAKAAKKAAARAAYEAQCKAILDACGFNWDGRKYIDGSKEMYAYGDSDQFEVPYSGDPTQEQLSAGAALLDPPTSSYGALRWSTGSSLVSYDAARKVAIVRCGTGICD